MNTFTIRVLQSQLPLILAASSFFMAAQAVAVQAPPRPPGSDKVRVEVGMDPLEVSRQKSAHNHSRGGRKDFTHDDTRDAQPDSPPPRKLSKPQRRAPVNHSGKRKS